MARLVKHEGQAARTQPARVGRARRVRARPGARRDPPRLEAVDLARRRPRAAPSSTSRRSPAYRADPPLCVSYGHGPVVDLTARGRSLQGRGTLRRARRTRCGRSARGRCAATTASTELRSAERAQSVASGRAPRAVVASVRSATCTEVAGDRRAGEVGSRAASLARRAACGRVASLRERRTTTCRGGGRHRSRSRVRGRCTPTQHERSRCHEPRAIDCLATCSRSTTCRCTARARRDATGRAIYRTSGLRRVSVARRCVASGSITYESTHRMFAAHARQRRSGYACDASRARALGSDDVATDSDDGDAARAGAARASRLTDAIPQHEVVDARRAIRRAVDAAIAVEGRRRVRLEAGALGRVQHRDDNSRRNRLRAAGWITDRRTPPRPAASGAELGAAIRDVRSRIGVTSPAVSGRTHARTLRR